jgi:hypothetical protein
LSAHTSEALAARTNRTTRAISSLFFTSYLLFEFQEINNPPYRIPWEKSKSPLDLTSLRKKLGLAGLRPARLSAIMKVHKGCYAPRVQGLGRPPLAGTSFILFSCRQ